MVTMLLLQLPQSVLLQVALVLPLEPTPLVMLHYTQSLLLTQLPLEIGALFLLLLTLLVLLHVVPLLPPESLPLSQPTVWVDHTLQPLLSFAYYATQPFLI